MDLSTNCPSFRQFFTYSPQCSFRKNSNAYAASTLTLPLCSHLAGVTLQSEAPLAGEPNAAIPLTFDALRRPPCHSTAFSGSTCLLPPELRQPFHSVTPSPTLPSTDLHDGGDGDLIGASTLSHASSFACQTAFKHPTVPAGGGMSGHVSGLRFQCHAPWTEAHKAQSVSGHSETV